MDKGRKEAKRPHDNDNDTAYTCSFAQLVPWAPPNPEKEEKEWHPVDPG